MGGGTSRYAAVDGDVVELTSAGTPAVVGGLNTGRVQASSSAVLPSSACDGINDDGDDDDGSVADGRTRLLTTAAEVCDTAAVTDRSAPRSAACSHGARESVATSGVTESINAVESGRDSDNARPVAAAAMLSTDRVALPRRGSSSSRRRAAASLTPAAPLPATVGGSGTGAAAAMALAAAQGPASVTAPLATGSHPDAVAGNAPAGSNSGGRGGPSVSAAPATAARPHGDATSCTTVVLHTSRCDSAAVASSFGGAAGASAALPVATDAVAAAGRGASSGLTSTGHDATSAALVAVTSGGVTVGDDATVTTLVESPSRRRSSSSRHRDRRRRHRSSSRAKHGMRRSRSRRRDDETSDTDASAYPFLTVLRQHALASVRCCVGRGSGELAGLTCRTVSCAHAVRAVHAVQYVHVGGLILCRICVHRRLGMPCVRARCRRHVHPS